MQLDKILPEIVEAIGTHFNVTTYTDKGSFQTTLLEGKVNMHYPSQGKDYLSVVLKPGEQAQTKFSRRVDMVNVDHKTVAAVNIDQVMAWNNGRFSFDGVKLEEAMKQLERWYDISIKYQDGKIPDIEFYGALSRYNSLAKVLDALKDSGVHFKIEGKTLLVMP